MSPRRASVRWTCGFEDCRGTIVRFPGETPQDLCPWCGQQPDSWQKAEEADDE